MKIEHLSRKLKPANSLHLDEAINIYGNKLFAEQWQNNPYAKGKPLIKGLATKIKDTHRVSVFYYDMEEGKPVKNKTIKTLQSERFEYLSDFMKMFREIRKNLTHNIEDKKLSYRCAWRWQIYCCTTKHS